jgi:PKD repeat protein
MKAFSYIATIAAALTLTGCVAHQVEPPPLSGPSGLALSLSVTASPETINQDGASQSRITISAIGPDGKAKASLPIRLDMALDGVAQDFGTLSARSVVTNTDGKAFVVYTAPPSPVGGITGTCYNVPGTCVDIVATASESGSGTFVTAAPVSGTIRLVPPGVILPPAGTPTASFTFTPSPVSVLVPVMFDASASAPGNGATAISSFAWSFGDGSTGTGQMVTHSFASGGNFTVTLTVTNDRGLSASTTQVLSASALDPFTGDWVFSPTAVLVGTSVLFNADQVQTSAGHQVTQTNWNFGDGGTGSGFLVTHTFTQVGTFNVVLSVTDDLGRKKVFAPKPVSVGTGAPNVAITFSPTSPNGGTLVSFNSNGTTTFGGATISSYQWDFGDPTSGANNTSTAANPTHTFANPGTYTVLLTVTDSQGRSGTGRVTVTVS